MVMRSASRTARKLTFLFGIFLLPSCHYIGKLGKCQREVAVFCVNLPVRRVFPIEALSSITRTVNFGLVADEAPMGFGNAVQLMH